MIVQILVGSFTSLVNFLIRATLLAAMVRAIEALTFDDRRAPALIQHTLLIAATGVLVVAVHLIEVSLWAATYALVGAAPHGTHFIYFAFVNYTTLGYGDIVPDQQWRMLGPFTALNGILLIGWSTALMLELLRHPSIATTKASGVSALALTFCGVAPFLLRRSV
jgi:Ion channel